ncbi:hypothetical protein [Sediminibacterium sp.]|uniref:hypothetical protein n=1 Tax=Sediminibacterium sp. TaxID=1917865 RepID=UPI0025E0E879|nr:hypothetical protein [Sediminibacterium sp.]
MLEKAARFYFNLVIRPIIEKQIEFRDLNNDTPFKSDWLYDKSTMEKYMDMLEPDDVLHEKYRLLCENDNLGSLKDHGLV